MDVLAIADISICDNETTINLLGSMLKSYANMVMVQIRKINKLVDMIKLLQKELKRHNDDLDALSSILYRERKFNKPPSIFNFTKSTYNRFGFNFNLDFFCGPRKSLNQCFYCKMVGNHIQNHRKKLRIECKNRHKNSSIFHETKLFVTSLFVEISDNLWYVLVLHNT
jgi:hypothetical protein